LERAAKRIEGEGKEGRKQLALQRGEYEEGLPSEEAEVARWIVDEGD